MRSRLSAIANTLPSSVFPPLRRDFHLVSAKNIPSQLQTSPPTLAVQSSSFEAGRSPLTTMRIEVSNDVPRQPQSETPHIKPRPIPQLRPMSRATTLTALDARSHDDHSSEQTTMSGTGLSAPLRRSQTLPTDSGTIYRSTAEPNSGMSSKPESKPESKSDSKPVSEHRAM